MPFSTVDNHQQLNPSRAASTAREPKLEKNHEATFFQRFEGAALKRLFN